MIETLAACDELVRRTRRILRQLEVKGAMAAGDQSLDAVARVRHILGGFHVVARQLRIRHAGRHTLEISDEYDVQDLLGALLRLDFDDVRPEEWTPSYAGGSSRMDFLLKRERIVVEVKKTRAGLSDRELGEQLIIDIARYKASPDCSTLVCFVYDPEGIVKNPRGLAADLEALGTNELGVQVLIEPSF